MTIQEVLGHGVLVSGLFLIAFTRPRFRRRNYHETVHLKNLPDSASLAGVPLRILLSDPSGPGMLLRDTLVNRPSTRDH
jgi:hypothetical protein